MHLILDEGSRLVAPDLIGGWWYSWFSATNEFGKEWTLMGGARKDHHLEKNYGLLDHVFWSNGFERLCGLALYALPIPPQAQSG